MHFDDSLREELDFGIKISQSVWTNCSVHPSEGDTWMVGGLYVPPGQRGMGWARKTFNRVLFWADENNIVLKLNPYPFDDGLSTEKLIHFYTKSGFEWLDDRTMYRRPLEKNHYGFY